MELLSGRMKEQLDAYSKYVIASCTVLVLLLAKNVLHSGESRPFRNQRCKPQFEALTRPEPDIYFRNPI